MLQPFKLLKNFSRSTMLHSVCASIKFAFYLCCKKTAEMMRGLGILQTRHIAVDILWFRKTASWFLIIFLLLAIVRTSKTSTRRRDLYYLGSVAANNYCSFHSLIVKNFPMCPLQCGCQPTNQRHSATRQRGSDANLGATGNHYWHQAHCLPFFSPSPGTRQTKWRFLQQQKHSIRTALNQIPSNDFTDWDVFHTKWQTLSDAWQKRKKK